MHLTYWCSKPSSININIIALIHHHYHLRYTHLAFNIIPLLDISFSPVRHSITSSYCTFAHPTTEFHVHSSHIRALLPLPKSVRLETPRVLGEAVFSTAWFQYSLGRGIGWQQISSKWRFRVVTRTTSSQAQQQWSLRHLIRGQIKYSMFARINFLLLWRPNSPTYPTSSAIGSLPILSPAGITHCFSRP